MIKYIISSIVILFILALANCSKKNDIIDYNTNDFFSNRNISFQKLDLKDESASNITNKYFINNVNAEFSPPINSTQLSEKEKNDIINKTGYGTDYFYTDSMFIDEKIKITCLVAYMKKDDKSLNNLISLIRSMKVDDNFTEEYYIINNKRNIQFKINMDNTTFIFYTVFEANNDYYLILNYTFPVSYLNDSMIRIANSLDSVKFIK